jgi:hypothetical protein
MLRVIVTLLVALCATSFAEARTLYPEPIRDQELVWDHGRPFLTSRGAFSTVVVTPGDATRSRAWFAITVINHDDRPVTVHDGAILAASDSGALRVFGYEQLEARERRRRFWENVGLGLSAAASGYAAGQQGNTTVHSSHRGNFNAYGGSGYMQGSYSASTVTTL